MAIPETAAAELKKAWDTISTILIAYSLFPFPSSLFPLPYLFIPLPCLFPLPRTLNLTKGPQEVTQPRIHPIMSTLIHNDNRLISDIIRTFPVSSLHLWPSESNNEPPNQTGNFLRQETSSQGYSGPGSDFLPFGIATSA
ncbi:MAG: hypothetical protein FJ135_02170 [Deltaproteobacteria bacterium]|nr:hypothetical protein [Deltaproteobacteria bacterium]